MGTRQRTTIEYLRVYEDALRHQHDHGELMSSYERGGQPSEHCMGCLRQHRPGERSHEVKRRFSWAVPNEEALETIRRYSPNGVAEIGAGGGYWAMLLRERGLDVAAYDPEPSGGGEWFQGTPWTEVLRGDHTAVIGHPDRTLLMVWPMYVAPWTHEAVELFDGDTIIYVGEGCGGCTGTDRMHALLGQTPYCPHYDEPCTCDFPAAQFEEVASVDIPQWWGLHDALYVYKRKTVQS